MKKPLFTGSGVAIVTPFTKETVDLPTLGKLLDFQMKNGTDAIIVWRHHRRGQHHELPGADADHRVLCGPRGRAAAG